VAWLVVRARQWATISAPKAEEFGRPAEQDTKERHQCQEAQDPQPARNAPIQAVGSRRILRPTIQAVAPYPPPPATTFTPAAARRRMFRPAWRPD
jgi:hypothetical protein